MILVMGVLVTLLVIFETARGALESRQLGGYERLLSRLTPNTNMLSLSHASTVLLSKEVHHDLLVSSVSKVMAKHPMLRSFIARSNEHSSSAIENVWMYCDEPLTEIADDVVKTIDVQDKADFTNTWQSIMQDSLNKAEFKSKGPLWRLTNIVCRNSNSAAWVFCINHGADDQRSINIIVNDLLRMYNGLSGGRGGVGDVDVSKLIGSPIEFPPSMEDAVAHGANYPLPSTLTWALFQMYNSLQMPTMLPKHLSSDRKKYEPMYSDPNRRVTFCEYFELESATLKLLREKCRKRGITITSILSAAMLCITNHAIQTLGGNEGAVMKDENLRFLLSVDLRPFGSSKEADWTAGTVACAAGAVDYVLPVTAAVASAADRTSAEASLDPVWLLAERCQQRSDDIIHKKSWVPESVRLFGLGMRYAQILPLVEQDAFSSATLGRGFSCGVSNMGLARFESHSLSYSRGRDMHHAPLKVEGVYYGTSHARNGVLCQLSCMSVAGEEAAYSPFCGTLQFTHPIIDTEEGTLLRDRLVHLIDALARD